MAKDLTLDQMRNQLLDAGPILDPFDALKAIAEAAGTGDLTTQRDARDLTIRMLERRAELNGFRPMLDSIAVAVGLYPYADPANLGVRDALEYEAHRPAGLEEWDIVFHRVQTLVYQYLLDGESVVLSAPTSFGKSLIVDGLLASGGYHNAAIVVPTIALIDETRRRITDRFGDHFKVLTHPSQGLADSNVIVMTQERILDLPEIPDLDLLVIDEFYKMDPSDRDRDRANLLNQAFYRLRKRSRQFYLLGPNIREVPIEMNEIARFVATDFMTVALDTIKVERTGDDISTLAELLATVDGQSIVFCKSPNQARQVVLALVDTQTTETSPAVAPAAAWVAREFHPEWSYRRALARGIGLHHGGIPRSLGQLAVRKFNDGDLQILVCTSTLIEGVNTAAKNVIIFDNKIATKKYDHFTFNNIRGRSGRMFSHFVGRVFLFHEVPDEDLPLVDMPALTQPAGTAPSLLVQLDDEDLSDASREELEGVLDDSILPREVILQNSGLDPADQIELARKLRSMSNSLLTVLSWTGFPTGPQLRRVCEFMWDDLRAKSKSSEYVKTAPQLGYRLNRLRFDGIRGLIDQAIDEEESPDGAVENVLRFTRNWAGFNFPRYLMALDRIQRFVLAERGLVPGNYAFYAASVESFFMARSVGALEEYGIPFQVSLKLNQIIDLDVPLDDVLTSLRELNLGTAQLEPFERELVEDTLASL